MVLVDKVVLRQAYLSLLTFFSKVPSPSLGLLFLIYKKNKNFIRVWKKMLGRKSLLNQSSVGQGLRNIKSLSNLSL